jgi:hypothetical protein
MNRRQLLIDGLRASAGVLCLPAVRLAASASVSSPPELVAHWKLDGDCQDATGKNHGTPRGVKFLEGVDGRANGAAFFNGLDSGVEAPDADSLNFGTEPFSIALWMKLPQEVESAPGDLVCKFTPGLRRGFNFTLLGNASGYSGHGDRKGVHFGIDNGINGSWVDCGRPWKTNPTIATLTVYRNQLYAAIGDASRPEDACRIFRFEGGEKWVDCGRLGKDPLTPSAMSTVVHKGRFYAGTGAWDWEKSNVGRSGRNHVYRYEGDTRWQDCGAVGNAYCVMSLVSFKGDLYASDDAAKCYRYERDGSWAFCGQVDQSDRLNCLLGYHGDLYAATTDGNMFRYESGTKWECIGRGPHGVVQVHKLQVFQGRLLAGTWPHGKVLRYEKGMEWTDLGQLGIETDKVQINEVNDLQVFNGKLYAGVIPLAEVYRMDGERRWTRLKSLVSDPAYFPLHSHSWARVTSMAEFAGRLYHGTSTCYGRYDQTNPPESGRVYSMEAGKSVSYDDDISGDWRHVVAVRDRGTLKLYVDGRLYQTSSSFDDADYNISCRAPVVIGFGENGYLSGVLDDIRLYRGSLDAGRVLELYKGRGA